MDKETITTCMELAGCAYGKIPFDDGTLVRAISARNDVQCFVYRKGDLLTVVFRGSNSPKDWDYNFMFCKKAIPYGNTDAAVRVHRGFLAAYACPEVRDRLRGFVSPQIRRIRITGHSYGAALATVCAYDFASRFPRCDCEVVLFGCPRVGNAAFRKSYHKRIHKTLRVENGNDIVTKIPLLGWGYRHVGSPVRIGARRLPFLFSFEAHRPENYFAALIPRFLPDVKKNGGNVD